MYIYIYIYGLGLRAEIVCACISNNYILGVLVAVIIVTEVMSEYSMILGYLDPLATAMLRNPMQGV